MIAPSNRLVLSLLWSFEARRPRDAVVDHQHGARGEHGEVDFSRPAYNVGARFRGRVKLPTGGDSPRTLRGRPGETPGPTVIVRMREGGWRPRAPMRAHP